MKLTTITLTLAVLSAGCTSRPTASEVYALRDKCAKSSKELVADLESRGLMITAAVNKYDIEDNRCYVSVTSLDQLSHGEWDTVLWDAQTHKTIAWSSSPSDGTPANGSSPDDAGCQTLNDSKRSSCEYQKAEAYIQHKTSDEK